MSQKFKKLVEEKNVDCYIVNTGDFMGKKVKPADTLGILEAIVEGKAKFKPWGPFSDIEIFEWEGFVPDLKDAAYVEQLKARMNDRLTFVKNLETAEGGFNKLPADALAAIQKVVDEVSAPKKAAAKKAAPAKKTAEKAAPAKKTAAKTTAAKKTTKK